MSFRTANNHYNCPIVTSYAENIKNNVDEITSGKVRFLNPFYGFLHRGDPHGAAHQGVRRGIPRHLRRGGALPPPTPAGQQQNIFRMDMSAKGEEVLDYLKETGSRGIVLAGRPYHVDPEINHGIPELINSYGLAVLTEDSISHLGELERPLIVMDQWMYHSRMYAAANYVKKTRESGSDPAELLRLRPGCRYHRLCVTTS